MQDYREYFAEGNIWIVRQNVFFYANTVEQQATICLNETFLILYATLLKPVWLIFIWLSGKVSHGHTYRWRRWKSFLFSSIFYFWCEKHLSKWFVSSSVSHTFLQICLVYIFEWRYHGCLLASLNLSILFIYLSFNFLLHSSTFHKEWWSSTQSANRHWMVLTFTGVQSYFEVNNYSPTPNGIHGPTNTRAKLQRYDPALYNLVREVFPCGNRIHKRCDAKKGESNTQTTWR